MLAHNGRGEWSLVFFTILTQMAVGAFLILFMILASLPSEVFLPPNFAQSVLWAALISLSLGGFMAFMHLGKPFRGGFALRNLRTSWLSREGATSVLFGLLVLAVLLVKILGLKLGLWNKLIIILAIIAGIFLIYSISRLYMLRTVPAWNNFGTPTSFFTSSLLLGVLVNAASWFSNTPSTRNYGDYWVVKILVSVIIILVILQLMINLLTLVYLNSQGGAASSSVGRLWVNFRYRMIGRWLTAIVSVFLLFVWVLNQSVLVLIIAFGSMFFSEVLGRSLFYSFYQRVGY